MRVPATTRRALVRVALAVAVGVGVTYLGWRHIGTQLHVTTDIVGLTTFSDFDVYRYIYRFYDITLVLPAVTTLAYLILARFGPLRSPPPARPWPPFLEETEPTSDASTIDVEPNRFGEANGIADRQLVWAVTRVGLPALAVGIEADISHSPHLAQLTKFSVAAALLYAFAVTVVTIALGFRRRHSSPLNGVDQAPDSDGWISQSIAMDLPVVNTLASVVVIPLLVLVSSSTAVTVVANGHMVHYPWFPAWFGAVITAVVLVVLVRALRRSQDSTSRLIIERRTLLVVVVPILLFMVTAGIEGAQGPFGGFDDAQAMVGAQLSFGHGLWPWRDLFLLHGFLADDLYGGVGMWVLSATRWGSNSGVSLFVVPFTIVTLYSFIVYFARKNTLLIVAGTLALVLGLLPGWAGTRYALLPVALILFDRVLRHGSWNRCLLLMVTAVLFSIVTPEATLLMLGILVTLVAADAIHRPRREPFVKSFSRTIRCAVTGAALVAFWIGFLLATSTFSGFVDYFQTTVSGHELWGAFSPRWSLTGSPWATIEFALPIALFLITIVKVVVKLARRAPWRPIEWVLVASSTPVLLFYQVALDRMDFGHVDEVFQTLIPFVVLWAMEIVRFADSKVVQAGDWFARRSSTTFPIAVPVTVLAVIAIAAGSPITLASWKNVPAQFHAIAPVEAPANLPLGYTLPGAVDTSQITDLGKVLNRYAGKNGPVFDFTNEMGIPYFLLNRVPGARFYHVESAQTAKAQNLEVSDLKRSRPHIVIFNDVHFGLPNYDGIWSMERNYIVSQYILDNYRPLLDTGGQLILLRDDLFKEAKPFPRLSAPPRTTGLYFDIPTCDWGDVPNFLVHPISAAASTGLDLPLKASGAEDLVSVVGWAFDTPDDQPVGQVFVVSGDRVVSSLEPTVPRNDVVAALHNQAAANSGFEGQVSITAGASYRMYALNADGSVTPLASASRSAASGPHPQSVTTPDGTVHAVRISPSEGYVEATTTSESKSFTLTVPTGTDLSSYEWMEMQSPTGFGSSRIQVTDSIQGGPSHVIALSTLPNSNKAVFTRVGSCLQWHGYSPGPLTMLVNGPPTSISVRLLK